MSLTPKKKLKLPNLSPLSSLLLASAGVVLLIAFFFPRSPEKIPLQPYSQFLNDVDKGRVARVKVGDRLILYQLKPSLLQPGADLFKMPSNPLKTETQSNNPFHSTGDMSENTNSPTESNEEPLLGTIPVYDPQLPERLQKKGVLFEAARSFPQLDFNHISLGYSAPDLGVCDAVYFVSGRG